MKVITVKNTEKESEWTTR